MSTPTPPSPSNPSILIDTISADTDTTSRTTSSTVYPYFFLLIGILGFIIFTIFIYLSRRRSKLQNARLQHSARDALALDTASQPRLRSWRTNGTRGHPHWGYINNNRGRNDIDSILEAGLDERGEAPPSYNAAAADKPPALNLHTQTSISQSLPGSEIGGGNESGDAGLRIPTPRTSCQPPRYGEHAAAGLSENIGTGLSGPTRPATAVIAPKMFSEADLRSTARR